jgi:hypothetical protein
MVSYVTSVSASTRSSVLVSLSSSGSVLSFGSIVSLVFEGVGRDPPHPPPDPPVIVVTVGVVAVGVDMFTTAPTVQLPRSSHDSGVSAVVPVGTVIGHTNHVPLPSIVPVPSRIGYGP